MSDNQHLELMLQLTHAILTDAVHAICRYDAEQNHVYSRKEVEDNAQVYLQFAKADYEYISRRASKEGPSFFTKTLPLLGKRVQTLLLTGVLDRTGFVNLGQINNVLFGWLFARVIDSDGVLRDPSTLGHAIAVKLIRQLTYLFYKYELPYSHAQETKVLEAFIKTEEELPAPGFYTQGVSDPILDLASNLIANVVHRFDASEIIPKHGPGSVATGEKPWMKMRFARIYKSLEEYFPFTEWMVPSFNWLADNLHELQEKKELESGTAKVVLVPKDSRGPRLISCEPLEFQWIQQGISKQLVELIESHPLTRDRVNFTDQEINRRHALWGSMGTTWVTLDMKDASDRVTTALVQRLFGKTQLLQYLLASRSAATKLPNGNIITLKKFAPMGSALCFPVEALVFWALSVASLHLNTRMRLSRALACVKVYGDDIITVAEGCAAVMDTLEAFHLKVNRDKSCTTGSFRESCGMDAYRGVDVTPIKLRSVVSSNLDDNTIVSFVEVSNDLYARRYFRASEVLEYYVRRQMSLRRGKERRIGIPTTTDVSPKSYLCFVRPHVIDDYRNNPLRANSVLQRLEVKALVSQPVSLYRKRPGWELLFRSLTALAQRREGCKPSPLYDPASSMNVSSYPLRGRVSLKPRWCLK